ncbi:SRPBCC family protein [Janibacter sp. GS2]|uniref:SRPBCC family protein n=1 Tax=Janibacter sp. GS2 TaxID=3442646 RepID=UPI003EBCEBD8
MSTPRFVFRHVWPVPAPVGVVTAALADIEHYPRWWPQVRSVARIDDVSGRGRIRSLLPVTLDLVLTREIEDREGGRLRVALGGDLLGWAGWSVVPDPAGTATGSIATFEQEVRVAARLDRAATLAPFVLRANHAWMMRQGRRGLARELTPRR